MLNGSGGSQRASSTDRWTVIRRQAGDVLAKYEAEHGSTAFDNDSGSWTKLRLLAGFYDLSVVPDADLPLGESGRLNLEEGTICFQPNDDIDRQHFTIAHELGHCVLEHPARDIGPELIDELVDARELTVRDGIYQAYSPRDRAELEANAFASELLAPVTVLRAKVLEDPHWSVDALRRYFGLSHSAMLAQMAAAFLPGPPEQTVPHEVPPMDGEQLAAAQAPSPVLVVAGPGTGKTRVLVERALFLVNQGVDPATVLVVTFTNKAAAEVQGRLIHTLGDVGATIPVRTFHSLGLELLQAYGHYIGLKDDPQIVTEVDAFVLLRQRVSELPLGGFEDLNRPALHLPLILRTISRAKDELVSPAEFLRLTTAWRSDLSQHRIPVDPELAEQLDAEQERARQSADVAAVYAFYENWLRDAGYVDFGDLVARAVDLFEIPEVAREIRSRYDAILVDEFQDSNYASGRLVHQLDGGRGVVWAVGDPRQSIYQFRGASPVNLREFEQDYPTAEILPLTKNYRSYEDILNASRTIPFPPFTGSQGAAPVLGAERGDAPLMQGVELLTADQGKTELLGIVERIRLRDQSIALGDIAVLCRTSAQALTVSKALDAADIANDWGGAMDHRQSFKDLMAVLLLGNGSPSALTRLGTMSEHHLPRADLLLILQACRARGRSVQAGLHAAVDGEIEGLSNEARTMSKRLLSLAGKLSHLPSPWLVLMSYLFEDANWPRQLFGQDSVAAQRQLMTIGQLADLARRFSQRTELVDGDDIQSFLDFVRANVEAGAFALSDDVLSRVDSVHVLTIHRAKGLEWRWVFLPHLTQQGFVPREGDDLPIPPGMVRGQDSTDNEFERACLLYVAVTRARDKLTLSYASKYGRSEHPLSLILPVVERLSPEELLQENSVTVSEGAKPPRATEPLDSWASVDDIPYRLLRTYDSCPKQFEYEEVYGLRDSDDGYLRFHGVLYETLQWAAEQSAIEVPTADAVLADLDTRWADHGPKGHRYEAIYRRWAALIVRNVVARLRPGAKVTFRKELTVALDETAHLTLRVDEIEEHDGRVTYRRYHLGPPANAHRDDHLLSLYAAAHEEHSPEIAHDVVLYYPADGTEVSAHPTVRVISNRIKKMSEFLTAIQSGYFPPKPTPYCVGCPSLFVCPQATSDESG